MPSYFNRYYNLAPDQAGVKTGVVVLLGGIGAVLASIVADRMSARFPRARLYVPAVAGVATAALMLIAFGLLTPGPAQFALIAAGATVMTGSIGPVAAVVVDVAHSSVRATAASVLALTQNLFGLAAGPLLTGFLSDAYGLPFALSVVPLFSLVAAAMFGAAARTYEFDLKNAEGVEAAFDAELDPQTDLMPTAVRSRPSQP
jgi:MFS family permease